MTRMVVSEVDGVPAFWVDAGRSTLSAALVFRHGMVDETFATSGWTHLLEHLALHGRGRGTLTVNGEVSLLTTRLDLHGPPDRVAEALTDIARWLSEPHLGHLAHEQSVLAAESELRGSSEAASALLWRYGAQGPGLAAYQEPGLMRATEASLRGLCARSFVRGNAALFLDGPPPAGLALDLPDGGRNPVPVARECGDSRPAAYEIRSGIVLSGVVARSAAATVLPAVLRELLVRELRERVGGAYAPWAHYEAVDAEVALVVAGSDARPAILGSLADRTLSQLTQVSIGTFDHSLVTDIVEQVLQGWEDPYRHPILAYRAALAHLQGGPVQDLGDVLSELRAVTVDEVVEHARSVKSSLLVGIDGAAAWRQDIPVLQMPSSEAQLEGRAYRSRNFPAYRGKLVVGRGGVQVGSDRAFRTVASEDLAGLLVYPDGAREVVSRDGWRIAVEPTLWAKGPEAASALDTLVPTDLHIPMPPREADAVPAPLSLNRRLRSLRGDGGVRRALVWAWLVFCLAVVAVGVATFQVIPVVGGAVGAVRTGMSLASTRGDAVGGT
jgi:hypothetical protein